MMEKRRKILQTNDIIKHCSTVLMWLVTPSQDFVHRFKCPFTVPSLKSVKFQAYKSGVVPSHCFSFPAQFSLRLPYHLQARDRQLPTMYYSMKKCQIRAREFWIQFNSIQFLKLKSQLMFAFFAAVNHIGGPRRKPKFTKWFVISEFRSICVFLCFKVRCLCS